MITPPANWSTLEQDVNSIFEVRIRVYLNDTDYVTYSLDDLASCKLDSAAFNDLSIGNVCSARLSIMLKNKASDYELLRRCKTVRMYVRLKSGTSNTVTSWVGQGVFYIDSIVYSNSSDLSITAYDELYLLGNYATQLTTATTFSSYMSMLNSMFGINFSYSSALSTTLDNLVTETGTNPTVGALVVPADAVRENARDVLCSIAAYAGGNFILDKSNTLKLVRLDVNQEKSQTAAGQIVTVASIDYDKIPHIVTGVDVGDYPSSTGWRIVANVCNGFEESREVAQKIVENMYTNQRNVRASNVHASGALISALAEIGDVMSVDIGNGWYYNFAMFEYNMNYNGGCWGEIGATRTDAAIVFTYEETWHEYTGWHDGWEVSNLGITTANIIIDSAHLFHLERLTLDSSNYVYKTTANISSGAISQADQNIETISGSFSYRIDGNARSIQLSGTRIQEDYPIQRRDDSVSYGKTYIENIYYYSANEIPAEFYGDNVSGINNSIEIIGARASGHAQYGAAIGWA